MNLLRQMLAAAFVVTPLYISPATAADRSPAAQQSEAAPVAFDYTRWQRVLSAYVTDAGRVDYAALKAHSQDLDQFAAQLASRGPGSHPEEFPTRESQLAYWINAYNALVLKGVVEHWPVSSVTRIGLLPWSFFWGRRIRADGREMTLDDIEGHLRKKLADPRIHFAINCASNSCPRLRREIYSPENVDKLLDEAAREYLNAPRNFRVDAAANRVSIPWILDHYREDFETYMRTRPDAPRGNPLLAFLRLYLTPKNRAALEALKDPRVDSFGYDWGINDVHKPWPAN